jgi:PTH1 family peptidyl-tRNA hydrolase
LESVTQHLGSKEFVRLRIGIGRKNEVREITGHVLGKFSADENTLLEKVLERAAGQMECWLASGLQKAMNQFNGATSPTNEEK